MSDDYQKFANDRFLRTVDATLLHRFLIRHAIDPAHLDIGPLLTDPDAGCKTLAAFLRGPKDRCPPSLTADLHRIAKLDKRIGLDVLQQEAARFGVALVPKDAKTLPTSRNVALCAFVDHHAVFEAAEDALDFLSPPSVSEFPAPEEGIEPDLSPEKITALAARAQTLFEADLRGRFCRVGTHEDGNEVHLCIRHGAPLTTTEVVEDGDERIRSYREIDKAVLAWSAIDGRLQVWGCAKARRADIAELFAAVILGRPGLFKDAEAQRLYTLTPVEQSVGSFAFRHAHAPEIAEVQIHEARVNRLAVNPRTGRQRTVKSWTVRDTEGHALRELHASLPQIIYGPGWQLAHLVIKIILHAPGRRRPTISVKIKPPQTLSFPRERHQQLVRDLLHRNGLIHDRDPAAMPVALSEAGDPADLLGRPVHCPADERAFDHLLRRGVLIEQRAAEVWDPCATCNYGADDRPIRWRGDAPYAACRLGPARDTVLDADDLATFRIVPAALATEIAEATGLSGPVAPVLPGVWHLGELQPQLPVVVVFARAALHLPALVAALRAVDRQGPIILLGPALSAVERGRWAEANIHIATLTDMLCDEPLLSPLALGRARLPRGGLSAPRLVIDRRSPAIVLDGAQLDLPPRPHALLLLLAECVVNGQGLALIRAIHQRLYGQAIVAKSVHNDAARELRGKLKSLPRRDGTAPGGLIETISGRGIRLVLAPAEIEITGAPRE